MLDQPSGRGKHKDPYSPAGPATEVEDVPDVLRRNKGFCQRFFAGKCTRGESCRYKHTSLPLADAAEFKRACVEKYAGVLVESASDSEAPSSPSSPSKPSTIGMCRNWESNVHCDAMPNCRWRHGPSLQELARVKALRAKEKGKGKGRGKGKGTPAAETSPSVTAVFLGRPPA